MDFLWRPIGLWKQKEEVASKEILDSILSLFHSPSSRVVPTEGLESGPSPYKLMAWMTTSYWVNFFNLFKMKLELGLLWSNLSTSKKRYGWELCRKGSKVNGFFACNLKL